MVEPGGFTADNPRSENPDASEFTLRDHASLGTCAADAAVAVALITNRGMTVEQAIAEVQARKRRDAH